MHIREITLADLPAVAAILHEGFPRRPLTYWQAAIANLQPRPEVAGFPRFGFVIEADNAIQGVILLLTADLGNGPRSNLSSWYVRPAYRKFATFLFQRTLKMKGGIFLNLSPSDSALPIATTFGFKPYTAGVIRLDARAALQRSTGQVKPIHVSKLASLPSSLKGIAESHLGYGCAGLELQDVTGRGIALYRITVRKGLVPCAQFVFGDPSRLMALAGPLMRTLLRLRIPTALIDSDGTESPIVGQFIKGRSIRFLRGSPAPATGDLLETELAIFGL
jgi:hypothetical protein